ncbi:dihydroxyacetone kinase subunit DhaK [Enterovibrio sp. ZSDZ35]|uniref:Dihydroxyacetone kinase subunit DhaK n=1 Tax=Enterovibrio qingdaonensis TaxID=2899818 RepID=A0ABT5QKC0_9GAMM|nr:dihydroxyacetone kinase subunit DhaK [Enterovibrio sp. ZSDZ35]MDD1781430.1 dihydroxyacetone kinase subunit DhaK [Enterovibrio sp. ZSDZ35]
MAKDSNHFSVKDHLKAYELAYKDHISIQWEPLVVYRQHPSSKNKVALVSGGGSGHEPLHAGFVGKGMLDAACPGEIFTSPSPDQIVSAIEQSDAGSGVLLIVKNYQGDRMNFEIASELSDSQSAIVLVNDDATQTDRDAARGLAGVVVVEKILGAAAEKGDSLEDLTLLGEAIVSHTRTIGVAFSACSFRKEAGETESENVEYGVGIHGERGVSCLPKTPIDVLVRQMIDQLLLSLARVPFQPILLVNSLGAATDKDLTLATETAKAALSEKGVSVARELVGTFATTLDTDGFSITLVDATPEWLLLWDAPVDTPALNAEHGR